MAVRLSFKILLFFFITSGAAYAAGCGDYKKTPTNINIELELPEPVYDLGKSIGEINKGATADEWLKKNGMQEIWRSSEMVRLGYASGGMAQLTMFRFKVQKYDRYGVYWCPYVDYLDLAMMFRTVIVIPKNFAKGGCRFNAVAAHEYKHYKANRDVAEEFVRRLHKDLPVIIREMENRQPYVEGKDVNKTLADMQASFKDAIESYIMRSMVEEGRRRNGMIDSPAEYAAAGQIIQACKD